MIIGIAGKKRAGKDTVASILIKDFGFKKVALADPLKKICSKVFQIPMQCFEKDELKDLALIEPEEIDVYHINSLVTELSEYVSVSEESKKKLRSKGIGVVLNSPREILQFVGTDLCRNCVLDSIWVDIFYSTVKKTEGHLVCTDARFPNERKLIKELGGSNMLVNRPSLINTDSHASENSLGTEEDYDIVVNNSGTVSELHCEITTWYTLKTSR